MQKNYKKKKKKPRESTKRPHYRTVKKSKNVSCATIVKVNNEELCLFSWYLAILANIEII